MRIFAVLVLLSFVMTGCDSSERIAKLEKDNSELRSEIEKIKMTNDYDMQEKCSRTAKEWFEDNFRYEKATMFLTYNVHYNKEKNSCFVVVEDHLKSDFGENGSWSNVIELWNVLENNKYASLQEDHLIHYKPEYGIEVSVARCEVTGKECKSLEEFNQLTQPYMAN